MRTILLSLLIFSVSCSSVPLTGRKQFVAIPSSQMMSLSQESYNQVLQENKLSTNTNYVNMVKSVGKKMSVAVEQYLVENNMKASAEGFEWQYNVIVSDQLNAWCMPGGQIAFYEGIMPVCEDEAGVAVVMGHEIAHAVAKHGNERMSQQLLIQMGGVALSEAMKNEKEQTMQLAMLAFGVGTTLGVQLPYSRTHEREADELGLYFMALAGYDPRTAPIFWQRMDAKGGERPPEFLSTHPDPSNRIKDIEKNIPKALEYYNQKDIN
ncbi:MAG: M48 family metallopeptidase [Bacteroidales bacterium]